MPPLPPTWTIANARFGRRFSPPFVVERTAEQGHRGSAVPLLPHMSYIHLSGASSPIWGMMGISAHPGESALVQIGVLPKAGSAPLGADPSLLPGQRERFSFRNLAKCHWVGNRPRGTPTRCRRRAVWGRDPGTACGSGPDHRVQSGSEV